MENLLKVADKELKIKSISIPALYYDVFGSFYEDTMIDGVLDFIGNKTNSLKLIKFVNPEPEPSLIFQEEFSWRFPYNSTI